MSAEFETNITSVINDKLSDNLVFLKIKLTQKRLKESKSTVILLTRKNGP